MKKLPFIAIALILQSACKKSEKPKIQETMTIAVTNVPSGGGYTIKCTDQATETITNDGTPFFSVTGSNSQTYSTTVYQGETVDLDDNFVVNNIYKPGAIINVTVGSKVVLTTPSNEDSGFHSIVVP